MESFIGKLKHEDNRNLQQVKSFKWIYLIFIIVYTLLYVINPDKDVALYSRISGVLFIGAFAVFYLIFRKYSKIFGAIDYSVPLSEMLLKVIDRYQLKFRTYLEATLPLVLIDIALVLNFYHDLTWMSPVNRILVVQAFVIPIFVGAAYVGYLIWRKRQKPLVENAKQMLNDLNAG